MVAVYAWAFEKVYHAMGYITTFALNIGMNTGFRLF